VLPTKQSNIPVDSIDCASSGNGKSTTQLTMTNSSHLNLDLDPSDNASVSLGNAIDGGKKHAEPKDRTLDQTLAKMETKAVDCLRLVTFLILVSAASLVSAAVYLIMKHDEQDTFEVQFKDLAFRLGTYPVVDLFYSQAAIPNS
jgi:hypothetical protein